MAFKKGQSPWNKKNLDERKIREMYLKRNLSTLKISKILNCSRIPIKRILKEQGIKIRNQGFYCKGQPNLIKDEKIVIEMYNKNISGIEIAKKFDCSDTVIYHILKRNGVKAKRNKKFWDKQDEIIKKYNKGMSANKISKVMGCKSVEIIKIILNKNNIKIRPTKHYLKGKHFSPKTEFKKGENHIYFNNWSSREPYGKKFGPKLKILIRKRDNYECQECGILQKELKYKLSIHHIDYNKQNNSIWNLISLCVKCHMKTNTNRKHWTNYFKMKMFLKEFFNPQNIKVFNEDRKLIAMERI